MSCSTYIKGLQTPVLCDLCDTGAAGEHYCTECPQTLCVACKKIHEKGRATKDHKIVLRSEIASAESTQASCKEHNEALYLHCLTCRINVCLKCITGLHNNHSLTGLKQMYDEDVDESRKELESSSEFEDPVVCASDSVQTTAISIKDAIQCRCQEHIHEEASYYCEKCNVPVCAKCITGKHRGHSLEEIQTTFEQSKEQIEKELKHLEGNVLPRCTEVVNEMHGKRESYKKTVAGIRKEMEEEVQTLKAEIDRNHNERNRRLDTKETNDLNSFLTQEKELQNLKNKVNQEISERKNQLNACRSNPAEFLKFAERREKVPHQVPEYGTTDIPHFKRMNAKSVSGILGKLEFSRPSTAKIALKPCKPHVVSTFNPGVGSSPTLCLTKNGLAWIGGRESRELRLLNFSIEIPERKQLETRLFALAIMENGDIVLSPHCEDSRLVHIMKTDGTEEEVFDATPSYTEGLSVTRDQHILVCTADGRLVKCDPVTKNTKQIYRGSSTLYQAIELPDKTICISDWGSCQLVIIDQEGNNVDSISRPLERAAFLPRGVVCDRAGNVLFSDKKNHCIYIMEPGRRVRELVGASHGITSPDWLVLDKDDNLMVTNDEGRVTVVKYAVPASE